MTWQNNASDEEALLHQMVEIIVREVSPEAIILFGSRTRGDSHPDSDVDLLIVETKPFSPQRSCRKEAARLYIALKGVNVSKDICSTAGKNSIIGKTQRAMLLAGLSAREKCFMVDLERAIAS